MKKFFGSESEPEVEPEGVRAQGGAPPKPDTIGSADARYFLLL